MSTPVWTVNHEYVDSGRPDWFLHSHSSVSTGSGCGTTSVNPALSDTAGSAAEVDNTRVLAWKTPYSEKVTPVATWISWSDLRTLGGFVFTSGWMEKEAMRAFLCKRMKKETSEKRSTSEWVSQTRNIKDFQIKSKFSWYYSGLKATVQLVNPKHLLKIWLS